MWSVFINVLFVLKECLSKIENVYQLEFHKRCKLSDSSQFSKVWHIVGIIGGTQEIRHPLHIMNRKK